MNKDVKDGEVIFVQEQVVGSKEWFQQESMRKGLEGEGWSKELKQAFSTEEKKEDAYNSYNTAKNSATGGYVYRRREVNLKVDEYFSKLQEASQIIWKMYLVRIQLKFQSLDDLDQNDLPQVLVEDTFEGLEIDSFETYEIFAGVFSEYFETEKETFISEIITIHHNDDLENKSEFFEEACQKFSENFLVAEKIKNPPKKDEEGKEDKSENNDDTLKNIASLVVRRKYFNIDSSLSVNNAAKALADGRIYQPPNGTHNWLNNLSWMLAHIHKRNSFEIFGQLTNEVMLRSSKDHAGDLSGFAREIALLTKLDYQFTLSHSTLILLPPQDESKIKNLSVEQAYMSDNEVKEYYKIAVEKFTAINQKEKKSTQTAETASTASSSSSSSESNIKSFFPSPLPQPTPTMNPGSSEKRQREPLQQKENEKGGKQEEQEPEEQEPLAKKAKLNKEEGGGGVPPPTPS